MENKMEHEMDSLDPLQGVYRDIAPCNRNGESNGTWGNIGISGT